MDNTPDMTSEAWERACDIVDRRMRDIEYPCKHGHIDCSTSEGGQCLNEETDREYARQLARFGRMEALGLG